MEFVFQFQMNIAALANDLVAVQGLAVGGVDAGAVNADQLHSVVGQQFDGPFGAAVRVRYEEDDLAAFLDGLEDEADVDFAVQYMNDHDFFTDTVYLDQEWVDNETAVYDLMKATGWMDPDAEIPRSDGPPLVVARERPTRASCAGSGPGPAPARPTLCRRTGR